MAKRKIKEKKVAYHCISNNLTYCLLLAEFDEIVIHPILKLSIQVIKTCLPFKAKINAFYRLCFTNSRAYTIHTGISKWQEEAPQQLSTERLAASHAQWQRQDPGPDSMPQEHAAALTPLALWCSNTVHTDGSRSFGEHGSADLRQQQIHQHIFPHHIIVTQTAMASRHPAKLSVKQGCAHHLPRNFIQVQGVVQVNVISMANVLRRLL